MASSSSSSSSSSISSSSSSIDSSSSSSHDFSYREIRVPIVDQNNYNLLPFSWIKENGTAVDLGDDAKLEFIVENSSAPYLDYTAVIDRDNSSITEVPTNDEPTVYVENDIEATHEASIYVDVIAQDVSGIRDVRVHTEPNKYEFEKVESAFIIPKFTWDAVLGSSTTTTTTPIIINSMLAGLEDGRFLEIEYNMSTPSIVYDFQLSRYVNNIVNATDTNNVYVSTNDNLYIYGADYFGNVSSMYQKIKETNEDRNIMSLYGSVWSVQAYNGKIVKMNNDSLVVEKEYSGFDAPFKILKSEYHDLLFVAGTNVLWTVNETTDKIKGVYEIDGYSIADFAISPEGEVCILFNGENESIIRVLDTDLYSMLLDERLSSNNNVRYCEYVEEGRFYALSELEIGSSIYASDHYVFDVNANILKKTASSTDIVQTTTTTTLGITTKAVEVATPNGGEQVQKGEEYEITWISSESATDLVQIDLYKSSVLDRTIDTGAVNDGLYAWEVPTDLEDGSDYRIHVTWLSASSDPNNTDSSNIDFAIGDFTATTTTTTAEITEYSIGIDYNSNDDTIIVVLKSGLYGTFSLTDNFFDGLYSLGVSNITSFILRDISIGGINSQTKIRVWVGSEIYYSDKWDSGIVETSLQEAYYGGGNNLGAGQKYFVHIQTYSENEGWGAVQIKEFVIPK